MVYPYSDTGMVITSPTSIAKTLDLKLVFLHIFISFVCWYVQIYNKKFRLQHFFRKMLEKCQIMDITDKINTLNQCYQKALSTGKVHTWYKWWIDHHTGHPDRGWGYHWKHLHKSCISSIQSQERFDQWLVQGIDVSVIKIDEDASLLPHLTNTNI